MRFLILILSCSLHAEITALYLSWYGDPATTMTIQWHTPLEETNSSVTVLDTEKSWTTFASSPTALDTVLIHTVRLQELEPNTEYHFKVGDDPKQYSFLTAPNALKDPLRFVVGGDLYHTIKLFRKMCQTVVEHDPLFVVIGGDIAYALGSKPFFNTANKRWFSFLKDWKELMITPQGRVIPFLITAGNHDISSDNYETFFNLFAFPEKQIYRTVDFGHFLSLILLDSGHFQPIGARQAHWLNAALKERTEIPYRFAIYHEAAYPSHYPYNGITPKTIRQEWVPLFEKYDLTAVFENHNHTYKRTHPILEGKVNDKGITYLGDGSWGTTPRQVNDMWYLAKKAKKNSVYVVELQEDGAHIEAYDLTNHLIDKIHLSQN